MCQCLISKSDMKDLVPDSASMSSSRTRSRLALIFLLFPPLVQANLSFAMIIPFVCICCNFQMTLDVFDRSTCSKRSKESLFSCKKMFVSIYSILVYFIMFSFQVLTCLRIVSIRIILNLNKFRQVGTCSDMFENCNNSYHIESEQVQTCFNMFRHV